MTAPVDSTVESSEAYHYIAAAIEFIREHHRSQPDLATIARHVHLSEFHFQRLFTKWAGISPKRFLQYLTVDYAKSRLLESTSLLTLTSEVGLSSPGRLHDWFVHLDAMSPGEVKQGGTGIRIQYGLHPTPFGPCLLATTPRGICTLQFTPTLDPDWPLTVLTHEWPQADLVKDPQSTGALCQRIFGSDPDRDPLAPPINLHIKGTNFQIQVWRALLSIPFGQLTTYKGVAETVGRPQAARAVGTAIGLNPVAILIPCHRVLRQSGELGGYRWGLTRKCALLGWEASQRDGSGLQHQFDRVETEGDHRELSSGGLNPNART